MAGQGPDCLRLETGAAGCTLSGLLYHRIWPVAATHNSRRCRQGDAVSCLAVWIVKMFAPPFPVFNGQRPVRRFVGLRVHIGGWLRMCAFFCPCEPIHHPTPYLHPIDAFEECQEHQKGICLEGSVDIWVLHRWVFFCPEHALKWVSKRRAAVHQKVLWVGIDYGCPCGEPTLPARGGVPPFGSCPPLVCWLVGSALVVHAFSVKSILSFWRGSVLLGQVPIRYSGQGIEL